MKIRTGFVSNSSSSSFVVIVHKEAEGANIIFDFFRKLAENGRSTKVQSSTVGKKREELGGERGEVVKDQLFIQDRIKKLKPYLKEKKLNSMLDKAFEVLVEGSSAHWQREGMAYRMGGILPSTVERLQSQLKDLEKKLKDIDEKLITYSSFPQETEVMSWTEDHMERALGDIIRTMENDGKVTVIERFSS